VVYTLSYTNTGGTTATSVVITETVPDHTTFNAAASSPGWSCANGSPAGTVCMLPVPNIGAPAGTPQCSSLSRSTVRRAPTLIRNTVTIGAAGGAGGSATVATLVGAAPAPALGVLGFVAALAMLLTVAAVSMRRGLRQTL
jgi:hypothetical protein